MTDLKQIAAEMHADAIRNMDARLASYADALDALAAQSQEPVAWRWRRHGSFDWKVTDLPPDQWDAPNVPVDWEPLYAAAPSPAPVPCDPAELEALRRDAARWQKIETLWFLGDVTLTTDEDQQFVVHVDPAEHASQAWTGIDQCAAIDAALAANGEKGS